MTDYNKIIAEDTETLRRMQAKTECPHCAELKAQTAAMLEKALDTALRYRHGPIEGIDLESAMAALIPTDYAAALAEHDSQVTADFVKNVFPPVPGGYVAGPVVAERVQEARLAEAEWWVKWSSPERTLKQMVERLAAHRVAAGAPEEK